MKVRVIYQFYEQDLDFKSEGQLNINVPGTKATAKLAVYLADKFLTHFREKHPDSDLVMATCVVIETGHRVFSFQVEV